MVEHDLFGRIAVQDVVRAAPGKLSGVGSKYLRVAQIYGPRRVSDTHHTFVNCRSVPVDFSQLDPKRFLPPDTEQCKTDPSFSLAPIGRTSCKRLH